jgi:hypothetical protein
MYRPDPPALKGATTSSEMLPVQIIAIPVKQKVTLTAISVLPRLNLIRD